MVKRILFTVVIVCGLLTGLQATNFATDSFTRMDSSTTMSNGWTVFNAGKNWGIVSNTAYYATGDFSRTFVYQDTSSSDLDWQCTISTISDGAGLFVRATDENNVIYVNFASGAADIYKKESGSETSLATTSYSFSHGDVVDLRASGTTITVFVNSSQILQALSVTFNQTATKHGLTAYGGFERFDDCSGTDIGGGGGGSAPRTLTLTGVG